MHQDSKSAKQQANAIQSELNTARLSRRGLFDRLKALGVGFGAAYVLGVSAADAAIRSDEKTPGATAKLNSTNPALNDIIQEGREQRGAEDEIQTAWFRRFYVRNYLRGYDRYARSFARFFRRF
jgi:hypothetical protein